MRKITSIERTCLILLNRNVFQNVVKVMNFYKLAIIIVYYFISHTAEENANYLTKNSTKKWFNNFIQRLSSKNPYCSICCIDTTKNTLAKTCGKHTMCLYQNGIYGPGCKGFLDIPLSEDEIDVILDAHNTVFMQRASYIEISVYFKKLFAKNNCVIKAILLF